MLRNATRRAALAAALIITVLGTAGPLSALEADQPETAGKAVLITGATSGIGRATAEHLAKAGYFVYAGARKDEDMAALNAIDNIEAVRLDVTKPDQVTAAVKQVEAAGRGLWGIVNNAGINIVAPLIEADEADLEFLFDVNVYGVFRVTQAFSPLVIEAKGRIVNISSISGVLSGYGYGMYAMSKHAVEAYTDTLSREMEDLGVAVAAIEPGNYASQIGVSRCERLVARTDVEPYRYFEDYRQDRLQRCRDWLAEGAPNDGADPAAVAAAVEHALFAEKPKDHYLVVPRQVEAGWTIAKAMEELLSLNARHEYSYTRDQLVELMDAYWPYMSGEKSFDDPEDEKAFGAFIQGWFVKAPATPD